MAKTRFVQNSFTSGLLSPLVKGRTDLDQYYQGLEIADNVVVIPQGGVKRRPGTEFLQKVLPVLARNVTAPTMPEGGTAANINDDNDATSTTTTGNIGVLNPYVVAKYDLGSAVYVEMFDLRGIFLTTAAASSTEFVIQHSDDDGIYTTAAVVPELTDTEQNFRLYVGATKQYWRLARVGATDLGTCKVTLTEFAPIETTATLSNSKLLDFSVETDRHYLLVLTDGNARVFRSPSTHVMDIKMPYTSAQVGDVRDCQTENVMLLWHQDVAPQRLINNTDESWELDAIPFVTVPQYDYNDSASPTPGDDVQVLTFTAFVAGDTFQIDVEGVLSKNITFAGDATADEQSATAKNIQKNLQDMPVYGETGVAVARTGANQYTVTVSGESTKDFELYSAFATSGTASKTIAVTKSANGSPRTEDVWSSTRGYPKTATFYQGRLWIGSTRSKRQSLFASKAGSFFDFDVDESDDDDAIFVTISSRKLTNIVDIFPGRNLQVFTAGSEFSTPSDVNTPQTINVAPQTSHGALDVEVTSVDGATIFLDRNGKTLREFIYSFNEDAYITNDVSVLAPSVIKTPVAMALLTGGQSFDANWLFIVNSDGTAAVLNKLRSQDINAFTEWNTDGLITDASVVDDELYMVVDRTIGGVRSNFLERWSFDHLMDCSVKKSVAATVTGLGHLEGYTVKVVADGAVLDDRTVTGGSITLTTAEQTHSNLEIGINFVPRIRPMPVNTNVGSGQNFMRIRKILRTNAMVYESFGLDVGGVKVPIRAFGDAGVSPLDTDPIPRTGIVEDIYGIIGWGRGVMPIFSAPDPTPFHISAIEFEVESS